MEGYDAATYGDRFADVYDDWYADAEATADAVTALVALGPRSVLELGVGTGRLAIPLAAAGLEVTGLDASPAMLARLAAKPGSDALRAVERGDMAGPLPGGPFDLVVLARNTFFNLTTDTAQASCLAEVARVLARTGRLVVEAFVPADDEAGPTSSVEVRHISVDGVVLFVDRHDPATGEAWSSFVDIAPDGVRFRPCHFRYLRPEALDALAATKGLVLERRAADWTGTPFGDAADYHVSTYRLA